jgi:hypothetical protein
VLVVVAVPVQQVWQQITLKRVTVVLVSQTLLPGHRLIMQVVAAAACVRRLLALTVSGV